MARGTGRPLSALVLSDEERSFLEAQVRRHRVARSISDRCRMILRCADGLGNKAVAAEIGVHEHTVGKWRRRFLKDRIEGLSDAPRPGAAADHRGREGGGGDRANAHLDTGGRHPLVAALDGEGGGAVAHDDLAHLVSVTALSAGIGA